MTKRYFMEGVCFFSSVVGTIGALYFGCWHIPIHMLGEGVISIKKATNTEEMISGILAIPGSIIVAIICFFIIAEIVKWLFVDDGLENFFDYVFPESQEMKGKKNE